MQIRHLSSVSCRYTFFKISRQRSTDDNLEQIIDTPIKAAGNPKYFVCLDYRFRCYHFCGILRDSHLKKKRKFSRKCVYRGSESNTAYIHARLYTALIYYT